jgi:hypothetical protein
MTSHGVVDLLGTQYDPSDNQAGMCWALLGASATLLRIARLQERQIATLPGWDPMTGVRGSAVVREMCTTAGTGPVTATTG